MDKDQENHLKKSPKKKVLQNQQLSSYTRYSGMVFQMGVIIFAGVFGGMKLDEKVKWEFPLFTLILSLFSVVAALYVVLKDFLKK